MNVGRIVFFTIPYMGFELTDGAIRMLVVLHFHTLGFNPFQIAALFLLYEIAGVVTNFIGGWLAANFGLEKILIFGLFTQVVAMMMMTLSDAYLSVWYVMFAQGLSGMAKDLVKVSSKTSIKLMLPDGENTALFKWVSIITGSKNALKGIGFLLGGIMMSTIGLQFSMALMALVLGVSTFLLIPMLPKALGKAKKKVKAKSLFAKAKAINILSMARFFLFGSRDVWFTIGLPVFLQEAVGWSYPAVAGFMATWIVGYGLAQSLVSRVFSGDQLAVSMGHTSVALWTGALTIFPIAIVAALSAGLDPSVVLITGLMGYGLFFAVNSIIHSYLVLLYSDRDKAAADVGFYYMANACGRLVGTLMSGWVYQTHGLMGCLVWSALFLSTASFISLLLPPLAASPAPVLALPPPKPAPVTGEATP